MNITHGCTTNEGNEKRGDENENHFFLVSQFGVPLGLRDGARAIRAR